MKPDQCDDEELSLTAYHEAGHAAMGWILGRQPLEVSIVPSDGQAGFCNSALMEGGAGFQSDHEHVCMIVLAGGIAQQKYSSRDDLEGNEQDHDLVAGSVRKMLSRLDTLTNSAQAEAEYFRILDNATREILEYKEVWRLVDMVTRILIRDRSIKGDVLEDILLERASGLQQLYCPHCIKAEYDTSKWWTDYDYDPDDDDGALILCPFCQKHYRNGGSDAGRLRSTPMGICRSCFVVSQFYQPNP